MDSKTVECLRNYGCTIGSCGHPDEALEDTFPYDQPYACFFAQLEWLHGAPVTLGTAVVINASIKSAIQHGNLPKRPTRADIQSFHVRNLKLLAEILLSGDCHGTLGAGSGLTSFISVVNGDKVQVISRYISPSCWSGDFASRVTEMKATKFARLLLTTCKGGPKSEKAFSDAFGYPGSVSVENNDYQCIALTKYDRPLNITYDKLKKLILSYDQNYESDDYTSDEE